MRAAGISNQVSRKSVLRASHAYCVLRNGKSGANTKRPVVPSATATGHSGDGAAEDEPAKGI